MASSASYIAENNRLREMESRIAEIMRKTARERSNLERRHDDETRRLTNEMQCAKNELKKKESELRKRLAAREQQLGAATAELRVSRGKVCDLQDELRATQNYVQQLLLQQPQGKQARSTVAELIPGAPVVDAAGNTASPTDTQTGTLATSRLRELNEAEIARLAAEGERLRVELRTKDERLRRFEVTGGVPGSGSENEEAMHVKIMKLEAELQSAQKEAEESASSLEAERLTLSQLRDEANRLREGADDATQTLSSEREVLKARVVAIEAESAGARAAKRTAQLKAVVYLAVERIRRYLARALTHWRLENARASLEALRAKMRANTAVAADAESVLAEEQRKKSDLEGKLELSHESQLNLEKTLGAERDASAELKKALEAARADAKRFSSEAAASASAAQAEEGRALELTKQLADATSALESIRKDVGTSKAAAEAAMEDANSKLRAKQGQLEVELLTERKTREELENRLKSATEAVAKTQIDAVESSSSTALKSEEALTAVNDELQATCADLVSTKEELRVALLAVKQRSEERLEETQQSMQTGYESGRRGGALIGGFLALAAETMGAGLRLSFAFAAWKDTHLRSVVTMLSKRVVALAPDDSGGSACSSDTGNQRGENRSDVMALYGGLCSPEQASTLELASLMRWRLTSSTGATYFASGSDGEGAAPSYSAAVETLRCYTSDIAASCAERSSGDKSRSRSTKLQRQPFQATTTTAAPMTHHAPYSAMDSELLRAAVEELLDVSREMSGCSPSSPVTVSMVERAVLSQNHDFVVKLLAPSVASLLALMQQLPNVAGPSAGDRSVQPDDLFKLVAQQASARFGEERLSAGYELSSSSTCAAVPAGMGHSSSTSPKKPEGDEDDLPEGDASKSEARFNGAIAPKSESRDAKVSWSGAAVRRRSRLVSADPTNLSLPPAPVQLDESHLEHFLTYLASRQTSSEPSSNQSMALTNVALEVDQLEEAFRNLRRQLAAARSRKQGGELLRQFGERVFGLVVPTPSEKKEESAVGEEEQQKSAVDKAIEAIQVIESKVRRWFASLTRPQPPVNAWVVAMSADSVLESASSVDGGAAASLLNDVVATEQLALPREQTRLKRLDLRTAMKKAIQDAGEEPWKETEVTEALHFIPGSGDVCVEDVLTALCRAVESDQGVLAFALDPCGLVLRRIEDLMSSRQWRISDFFRHVDVYGYGAVTLSDLRTAMLKWGILNYEMSGSSGSNGVTRPPVHLSADLNFVAGPSGNGPVLIGPSPSRAGMGYLRNPRETAAGAAARSSRSSSPMVVAPQQQTRARSATTSFDSLVPKSPLDVAAENGVSGGVASEACAGATSTNAPPTPTSLQGRRYPQGQYTANTKARGWHATFGKVSTKTEKPRPSAHAQSTLATVASAAKSSSTPVPKVPPAKGASPSMKMAEAAAAVDAIAQASGGHNPRAVSASWQASLRVDDHNERVDGALDSAGTPAQKALFLRTVRDAYDGVLGDADDDAEGGEASSDEDLEDEEVEAYDYAADEHVEEKGTPAQSDITFSLRTDMKSTIQREGSSDYLQRRRFATTRQQKDRQSKVEKPAPSSARAAALGNIGAVGQGRLAQERQLWEQTMPDAIRTYTQSASYEAGLPPSQRASIDRLPVAPGEMERTAADAEVAGNKLKAMERLGLVDPVSGEPITAGGRLARHMQRALAKDSAKSKDRETAESAAAAAGVPRHLLPGAKGTPEETLPRLMQSLRTRLAEEVYLVSESLFSVVEADFREADSVRPREPKPVDVKTLQRFHARLVQASNGTLRWLLLIYLRTYESLRQMLDQRAKRKAQQRKQIADAAEEGSVGGTCMLLGDEHGGATPAFSGALEATHYYVAEGVTLQRRHSPFDAMELPGRNILEKRMAGVLEDMRTVWTRQRRGEGLFESEQWASTPIGHAGVSRSPSVRSSFDMDGMSMSSPLEETATVLGTDDPRKFTYVPGDKEGYHLSCRHTRVRKGCAHCTRVAQQDRAKRFELGFVDQGAGPREFWQNVNYPKQQPSSGGALRVSSPSVKNDEVNSTFEAAYEVRGPDGKKRISFEKMEAHLWRLALLVRCQDRNQDLRLYRSEPQRKLLDSRFYEILLLYMRHLMVEEALVRESPDGQTLAFAPTKTTVLNSRQPKLSIKHYGTPSISGSVIGRASAELSKHMKSSPAGSHSHRLEVHVRRRKGGESKNKNRPSTRRNSAATPVESRRRGARLGLLGSSARARSRSPQTRPGTVAVESAISSLRTISPSTHDRPAMHYH